MKFERINNKGLHYEYEVIVPSDDVEKCIMKKVKEKATTFDMRGFRKGHVPLDIVRQNVEASIMSGVLNSVISEACNEILEKENIGRLSTQPAYRLKARYEKGKDLALWLFFDKEPVFELKPYDIELEKIVAEVTEKDIEEAQKKIIESAPIYEAADKDHAIKPKDRVSYKAICYKNGVEDKKSSYAQTMLIPADATDDADFSSKFVGKKVGESFEHTPSDGVSMKYQIIITSITRALSDLSPEEYAKRRGFGSLQELNDVMKEAITEEIDDMAFVYHKYQILEKVADNYEFEVPEAVLEHEMNLTLAAAKQDQERELEQNPDAPRESDEQMRENLKEIVRRRCMMGYVLKKVALKERIAVSNDEVAKEISNEIEASPENAKAILNYYRTDPEAYKFKRIVILERKVVDFLVSKAKVKEVKKTRDELAKLVHEMMG